MKRIIIFMFALSIITLLAACGGDADKEEVEVVEEETNVEVSNEEKVKEDEVVANVNGTELTGKTYNLAYVQIKVHQSQTGQDIDDTDLLKDNAIEAIIGQELLRQDAEDIGIDISDEKVDTEFIEFKKENEEQFESLLEQYTLTEEAFKDQLYLALIQEEYLASDIEDIEVTDQEVESSYEELKEENDEIPELDEVRTQLEDGLKQEKLLMKIEKLKEKAEIETMI